MREVSWEYMREQRAHLKEWEGGRAGQREKVFFTAVTTKAPATPTGSSGAG